MRSRTTSRRAFLKAVELLPGLMENRGKGGYDEYCRDILETLSRLWDAERTIGSIPLQ